MSECEIKPVSNEELDEWTKCVLDPRISLVKRARALWGLKHSAEPYSIECISKFLINVHDKVHPAANALLQHEAAYCLGQKGDYRAIPVLINVVRDEKHCAIVRHEAGEALAALAGTEGTDIAQVKAVLQELSNTDIVELAETCQLGLQRINWVQEKLRTGKLPAHFRGVVDPTPAFENAAEKTHEELSSIIADPSAPLYDRYRALFTLRDRAIEKGLAKEVCLAISKTLPAPGSALLRHEIAFVLGELAAPPTIPHLCQCVANTQEHPMARHEAAEALGAALGSAAEAGDTDLADEARTCLNTFLHDDVVVVRESCVLALDVADYITSNEFQYAAVPS